MYVVYNMWYSIAVFFKVWVGKIKMGPKMTVEEEYEAKALSRLLKDRNVVINHSRLVVKSKTRIHFDLAMPNQFWVP